MKVSELKAILERLKDDSDVVIPVKYMSASIGGTPTVSVKNAFAGFDWDHGKVLLHTNETLHIGGEVYDKERKALRDRGEALAYIWMSLSNKTLDTKQKLSSVRNTIKRFGFNTEE